LHITPAGCASDVCSRVCDQAVQCEGACTWSLAGGTPIAIGALERFVTEQAPVPPLVATGPEGAGLSVAVVGSGPAGIGAAWELLAAGAEVTVLERDEKPGGLLGWGIPDFTLPAAVAARPWHQLVEAGATLRCGVEVAPEDVDQLLEQYDAVVVAIGAGAAIRLPVEGGTLGSVIDATEFLTSAEISLRDHARCRCSKLCVRKTTGRRESSSSAGGTRQWMSHAVRVASPPRRSVWSG
jgi:NADPH-dependent glutamate synthase beta subunit-like oxidoreductase